MKFRVYVMIGTGFLAVAAGLYLLYKFKNPIKFQSLKLLDKPSLLHLLSQIRSEFSNKFSVPVRFNRKKRRMVQRGGREYRLLIKDLKEQAKRHLQNAIDEILLKNRVSENILADSVKHLENDEEIKKAMGKICSIEILKASGMISLAKLEEILDLYIREVEGFNEEDPNELTIKMKMLEDRIHDDYGYEPEEIELAVNKHESELQDYILTIRELNTGLLERMNEELFF